jgi:hypothetical protein
MSESESESGMNTACRQTVQDKQERDELIRRMYQEARELEVRLKKNERLTADDLAVRVNLSV